MFQIGGKEFMKKNELYIRVNCLGDDRKEWIPIYATELIKN